MHDKHGRHGDERGDGGEIAQRLIAEIGIERRVDRHRAGIAEHQHVTVGRRRRHHLGRHHAAGTRHVLDHERLAEGIRELLRKEPRQHVGIAARRRRGDKPHRLGRIGLLRGNGACERGGNTKTDQDGNSHDKNLRLRLQRSPPAGVHSRARRRRHRNCRHRQQAPRETVPALLRVRLCCAARQSRMVAVITLFSYPELFGVADNNPYGLKVFAFLKLCGLPFRHEHVFDASAAPRGQLPYVIDDEHTTGDSDAIIAHLTEKYRLTVDAHLSAQQRNLDQLIRRMLDDLYWVMSYSRWRDPRYWPLFRDEMMRTHPSLTASAMEAAQKYNFERYRYQGIGRYEPDQAYARGLADLKVLADIVPAVGFPFGAKPSSIDAGIYGFVANIYFYRIETPLKQFVDAQRNLVRNCEALHAAVTRS